MVKTKLTGYLLIAVALAVHGCWIKWSSPPPTPEQLAHEARLREDATRPIFCSGGDDCALKWARALAWVHDHSEYRIDATTDPIIMTAGPVDDRTAFKVFKEPAGNGVYRIRLEARCAMRDLLYPDNDICRPKVLDSMAAFMNYVNQ